MSKQQDQRVKEEALNKNDWLVVLSLPKNKQ